MPFQKRYRKPVRSRKPSGPIKLDKLIERAEDYDDKYAEVMVHSIELYSDHSDEVIDEFLSQRSRSSFT